MSVNPNEASMKIKWRVGLFTFAGVLFIGVLSIYINNRPFWWRPCEPVQVTIEDATGLKKKAPVKTLGMDIGYIADIGLVTNGVRLNICITAPVETLPETKAYVRGEGFLGDKFLELKPMRYTGKKKLDEESGMIEKILGIESANAQEARAKEASAEETGKKKAREVQVGEKSADMQEMMTQLNSVMGEVKSITSSLKESINPEEIRGTIRQLNKTLEEAAKTFSPQGGLTQTAQRTLIKLEDTIEQFRDQVTRINQGQGSLGKLLNDPIYAEEIKKAVLNINKLLGRASDLRLSVKLGVNQLHAYNASRGEFQVAIWPRSNRYYLLGLASDPRGTISQDTITTSVGGTSTTVQISKTSQGGFAITGMIGTVFAQRLDISVGVLHGDGAASLGINLGPESDLEMIQIRGDLYFRGKTINGSWTAEPDSRSYLTFQPFSIFYLTGGIEGLRKVGNQLPYSYGAGLRFDDEDIKLLFSFL